MTHPTPTEAADDADADDANHADDADDAPRGEFATRLGGDARLADGDLLVVRDGETVRVPADRIVEATFAPIDWFLVLTSVAVVGFGVVSLDRSVPIGVGFVAVGAWSLRRTYRRRDEVRIRVRGRTKPLTLYPQDADEFRAALRLLLDRDSDGRSG